MPVLADQPADAAAERQTAETDRGHVGTRRRQPVVVGLGIVLAPGQTRLRPGDAPVGVDLEPLHGGQVDDQPAVDGAVAGRAVPAAAHRQRQIVGAGELDRRAHVVGVAGANDQRRVAIDRGVPDLAGLVVTGVAWPHDLAAQPLPRASGSRARGAHRSSCRAGSPWCSPLLLLRVRGQPDRPWARAAAGGKAPPAAAIPTAAAAIPALARSARRVGFSLEKSELFILSTSVRREQRFCAVSPSLARDLFNDATKESSVLLDAQVNSPSAYGSALVKDGARVGPTASIGEDSFVKTGSASSDRVLVSLCRHGRDNLSGEQTRGLVVEREGDEDLLTGNRIRAAPDRATPLLEASRRVATPKEGVARRSPSYPPPSTGPGIQRARPSAAPSRRAPPLPRLGIQRVWQAHGEFPLVAIGAATIVDGAPYRWRDVFSVRRRSWEKPNPARRAIASDGDGIPTGAAGPVRSEGCYLRPERLPRAVRVVVEPTGGGSAQAPRAEQEA